MEQQAWLVPRLVESYSLLTLGLPAVASSNSCGLRFDSVVKEARGPDNTVAVRNCLASLFVNFSGLFLRRVKQAPVGTGVR